MVERSLLQLFLISAGMWPVFGISTAVGQTIQVTLPEVRLTGKPLAWSERQVLLVQPDGQLVQVAPHRVVDFHLLSPSFRPYSAGQMRGQLLKEFGRTFEVTGTQHYLVVHPMGERDLWVDRFEALYRSMHRYFVARGFAVGTLEFPLVAIVFPTQAHFLQYARQQQIRGVGRHTLGVYLSSTNRILMYDVAAGQAEDDQWYINAETIIHEAAHQVAYNLNIHRRFAATPVWVVEGLGTMFEARGVWKWSNYPDLADRVHRLQLNTLRRYLPAMSSVDMLVRQVQSDELFQEDFELAYAHAWALTFFLSEQEPRRYAAYLKRLADLSPIEPYPASRRMEDFMAGFGADLRLLNARMQRFLAEL